MEKLEYSAVNMQSLRPGMLVERPLYIFLEANQRYICMVKPLHPLEPSLLEKMKRLGQVYSPKTSIDDRYPKLDESSKVVRELCENDELAPFEKNIRIRAITEWLVQQTLKTGGDLHAPLFFFHRAFGVPKSETLLHVSNISVEIYEQSLKLSAVSGLVALWLGYSDPKFLSQFVEAVFCEQIYQAGDVPGVSNTDYRFRFLVTTPDRCEVAGDEMHRIVQFAHKLVGVKETVKDVNVLSDRNRIARKLKSQFKTALEMMALDRRAA